MRISVLKAALKLPCYLKAGGCSHPGSEQQRGARPWRMGKALGLSYTPRSAEVSFSGDRTSSEVLKAPGPVSAISMDVCFTALAQERLHTPMWWAIILHSSCRNHLLLPFHNHFGWNADLGQGLTSPLTQDSPELCPPPHSWPGHPKHTLWPQQILCRFLSPVKSCSSWPAFFWVALCSSAVSTG